MKQCDSLQKSRDLRDFYETFLVSRRLETRPCLVSVRLVPRPISQQYFQRVGVRAGLKQPGVARPRIGWLAQAVYWHCRSDVYIHVCKMCRPIIVLKTSRAQAVQAGPGQSSPRLARPGYLGEALAEPYTVQTVSSRLCGRPSPPRHSSVWRSKRSVSLNLKRKHPLPK